MQTKICKDCKEAKLLNCFYASSSNKDGLESRCKDCCRIKYRPNSKPRKQSPYKNGSAEYLRHYRYALTTEQYQDLLNAQGRRCAICGDTSEKFYIDHDHACCPGIKTCGNCVRGLLCFHCNTALGQIKDNPKILLSMIEYLGYEV